uniref:Uncharacterized protein n=1 Tax=Haptolina ericina TaxID=156174 RepID=A0A7S3ES21_9EUKA
MQTWDGSGWDFHSCVWPKLECERSPGLVAASVDLGPLLPPKRFPHGEGALLASNRSQLTSALARRDAVHFVAFRNWVNEGPELLWNVVKHVLTSAVERTAVRMSVQQQACVNHILAAGVKGLWEPNHGRAQSVNRRRSLTRRRGASVG